jgi:6-phosphogluconate dehydrogenase
MICEAYWLMKHLLGLSPLQTSEVFRDWNQGELGSYLIGITADILATQDPESGEALVDMILDTAEQKGTGKWTSQVALDLGVTAPTIADAVFARTVSALKTERVAASRVLAGPSAQRHDQAALWLPQIRQGLLAAKICAYAQGFALMRSANLEYGWNLSFERIAKVWRAGCIIRANLLEDIRLAFDAAPNIPNLLLDSRFASQMQVAQQGLREIVAQAALQGVPVPAFMSALSYYDAYRSERLPANLLQAQRDYFGAHTYQRTDREGKFHTRWHGLVK